MTHSYYLVFSKTDPGYDSYGVCKCPLERVPEFEAAVVASGIHGVHKLHPENLSGAWAVVLMDSSKPTVQRSWLKDPKDAEAFARGVGACHPTCHIVISNVAEVQFTIQIPAQSPARDKSPVRTPVAPEPNKSPDRAVEFVSFFGKKVGVYEMSQGSARKCPECESGSWVKVGETPGLYYCCCGKTFFVKYV